MFALVSCQRCAVEELKFVTVKTAGAAVVSCLLIAITVSVRMQETMARTLRTVARHWLRTLADNLLSSDAIDAGRATQLLEQARGLATGAVQAAFPVILQQELDALLRKTA